MPNKAIFLDLDSTLIQTRSGKKFPKNKHDWKFTKGIIPRLLQFAANGYYIIIVSNQGGISEGYVTKEDFEDKIIDITLKLMDYLHTERIHHYYCSEMSSFFRKPNPGMAYQAALDLEIDLSESIMVGDASGFEESFSDSDVRFARKSGMHQYWDIDEFLEQREFQVKDDLITLTT